MISQEKLLLQERLGKILHDWNITDELEAVLKTSHHIINTQQMNQIFSLGLIVSEIYRTSNTLVIQFSSTGENL